MLPAIVTFAIAAFLSGAVIAVFVILVISIHASDRRYRLTAAPGSHLDAFARHILGVEIRTGPLGSHSHSDRNED